MCAKELGIKPVNDMMTKMGITEEELENMEKMFSEMLPVVSEDGEDNEEGPTIDFSKLMKNAGFTAEKKEKNDGKKKKDERKHLNSFCHNLTQDALNNKLDKIIGRERELERVIQILSRRQKNNPCLIANGDVPYKLRNCEIYL